MSDEFPEGWKWIPQRKKWHYFVRGHSLCGVMRARVGTFNKVADGGPDACKTCQGKLDKQHAI